ncbi:hypothetical protein TTHERM_00011870 (macronuclear) [Tetrahymena thermophila SB210]|uniref:Uncharacterized protein n=1 Tax=Tetrahymena thermophila (strain SB210) TaxID=312017 RepID=Q22RV1_TETTS|nr:hypothetical protein TTHERM_00011870 [Tetrahymena thermophila SB210]EAR88021.1 hypothetical protein TTHERM_00011870 [Tetrahymena thermophila SB210]|eukprot:XP_001008266.1 hypothetical protein TTHERM_00011870 [Tetrahymena thermophila SB210]
MGCHNAKPSSSSRDLTKKTSRLSIVTMEVKRASKNAYKQSQKADGFNSVVDYTMTLKQLQFMREGLQNMPVMPPQKEGQDPLTQIQDKKIIQRHQKGLLSSFKSSKLFQRRKTQLTSTTQTNSLNGSFTSKQQ